MSEGLADSGDERVARLLADLGVVERPTAVRGVPRRIAGSARRSPRHARPQDRRLGDRRDARRVRDVRPLQATCQGHDLRFRPHHQGGPALRAGRGGRPAVWPSAGWMVVTGAGPGIMQAGMQGAGRERSRSACRSGCRSRRPPTRDRRRRQVRQHEVLLHPQADAGQGELGRSCACPAGSARSTRRSSC